VQSNKQVLLNGQDRLKVLPQKAGDFDKLEQRLDQIRRLLKHLNASAALASA
jgi:transcription-repair coupling factor (superfamily II helicase)